MEIPQTRPLPGGNFHSTFKNISRVECLLCAQQWAKLQGSSLSCTPPMLSILTCSQGEVSASRKESRNPGRGGTRLCRNFWPWQPCFSGPKSWCKGGARGSESTPFHCLSDRGQLHSGDGLAVGWAKNCLDSRLLTLSGKFLRTPINFF